MANANGISSPALAEIEQIAASAGITFIPELRHILTLSAKGVAR